MAGSDGLAIIAEVSLGLAGFSGVVVILGRRDAFLSLRLAILLATSLGAMLMALLPFALVELGLSDARIWLACDVLLAIYPVGLLAFFLPGTQRYGKENPEIFGAWVLSLGYSLPIAASVAGLLGLFQVLPRLGAFLLGLIFLVATSVFMFTRILFTHPTRGPEA